MVSLLCATAIAGCISPEHNLVTVRGEVIARELGHVTHTTPKIVEGQCGFTRLRIYWPSRWEGTNITLNYGWEYTNALLQRVGTRVQFRISEDSLADISRHTHPRRGKYSRPRKQRYD